MGSLIATNIHDLKINPIRQIKDERGAVMHMINKDSEGFVSFGEAYFSKINAGVVKAWKYHEMMVQNFCVPFGVVKLVFFDDRPNSPTKGQIDEIILDDDEHYRLVTVPKQLWYGFQSISSEKFSLLANLANMKHDPQESKRIDLENDLIPYKW